MAGGTIETVVSPATSLLGAVLGVSIGLGPSPGPAPSEPKLAVTPIVTDGDVSEVASGRIEAALMDELRRRKLVLIEPSRVVELQPGAATCREPSCLAALASEAEATHALQLSVVAQGRDYSVKLTLVDVDARTAVLDAECPICGFDEVGAVVAEQAGKLAPRLREQEIPGRLIVRSDPEGATVSIDGEPVGVTPVDVPVEPGAHEVSIEQSGYFTQSRDLVAVSGARETLDLQLQALPPEGPGPLWIGGWTALGLGLAGVATGATLLAIHHQPVSGRCGPEAIDANGVCRWRYDTVAGGATSLGLGVAGVVAGTVLLVLDRKRLSGRKAQVYASPLGVGLRGRF